MSAEEHARIGAVYAARDQRRYASDRADMAQRRAGILTGLVRVLQAAARPVRRVLEVGCGRGDWLRVLAGASAGGRQVIGVDLLAERLAAARMRLPGDALLLRAGGTRLPLATGSVDLVLLITVLSSVLDDRACAAIARECRRVLAPGGCVVVYDFVYPNPGNRDVRPVTLRHLQAWFPDCHIDSRRLTLAPPLARVVAPRSRALARLLEALPPLRSHRLTRIMPCAQPRARLAGQAVSR